MRIVDLRPAVERHFSRRWYDGNQDLAKTPKPTQLISGPWARLADVWMARRVAAREAPCSGPYVLSVGNLALGGTGKTPVIMALAQALAGQGNRGCVLTRGFKSPLAGPLVVDHAHELAGDEARLMALRLAPMGWPVVQARNRAHGLTFILNTLDKMDFILIEDGHQTRKVGRHLDILILDRWSVVGPPTKPQLLPAAGPIFPFGPYRESAQGAVRAGILLLETTENIAPFSVSGQVTANFSRKLALRPAGPGAATTDIKKSYAVVSGIARPVPFERQLAGLVGQAPRLAIRLRDHQEYSPRLVAAIFAELDIEGGIPLVTTAKDWVKLQPFWPGQRPALVAELDLEWGQPNALPQLVKERAGK